MIISGCKGMLNYRQNMFKNQQWCGKIDKKVCDFRQ